MSKPTVYLETTIPSYLAGRISRNLVAAAKQQMTRDWWADKRQNYDLFVSAAVEDEAGRGDAICVAERLRHLAGIPFLEITPAVLGFAKNLARKMALPEKKKTDALHIAVAACHQMDFLLTWNCTHINNAQILAKVEVLCEEAGYRCPIICTPQELT